MRVAVIGSRTFDNYELLKDSVKILKYPCWSQGAKGADSQGERYGVENDIEIMIFKPDWKKYGREVCAVRNKQIVEAVDFIVAFWDGESKGTKNSIEFARKIGKEVKIINHK